MPGVRTGIESVAPVGRVRKHHERGLAERAGQVGHRDVAGHHDVQAGDDGRGVVEVRDLALQVHECSQGNDGAVALHRNRRRPRRHLRAP